MSMQEKILLRDLSNGSEPAFRQLFEVYRDRLFAYVNKIVKSREFAEEIVMDVFTKIWQNREFAEEINAFEKFLFKIASNRAIDFLRKAAKDQTLHNVIWEEIQIAGDLNPDNWIIERRLEEDLQRIITLLPPQRKLIFKLSREEELSYEEIATKLHISKNTVRNQLVEALRFIREQLRANPDLILLLIFLKKI